MTQRGAGRWRLQVTADPDPLDGTQRRLSRTVSGSRVEAREALQRLVVEAGAGLAGWASATVASLLHQFMTTANLAPTTRQDWDSVISHHLNPSLGVLPLWKLTARDCDQLYATMAASGIGPSRVRCAHVVLHRAVAQAVRWGWLARNPVARDWPRSTNGPHRQSGSLVRLPTRRSAALGHRGTPKARPRNRHPGEQAGAVAVAEHAVALAAELAHGRVLDVAVGVEGFDLGYSAALGTTSMPKFAAASSMSACGIGSSP